jgi:phage terminase large subunit GpA-like protein
LNARTPPEALAPDGSAWASEALRQLLTRVMGHFRPRERLSMAAWAERFRWMSIEESATPGRFSLENTPALRGVLHTASDPNVRTITAQKSAQIGWTAGFICTVFGYHVHWKPSVQIGMFPREKSAKDFDAEKFSPMVQATKSLARRIRLRSRSDGNSTTRKKYPGGLLKFVASNSPSDVKSTSARVAVVEEPDDANRDVRGQGNSVALLLERVKTYDDHLFIMGGTPTALQTSLIVQAMRKTDQRRFMVACHHCGERHSPVWSNVVIPEAPESEPEREIYGRARWEEAYYACPHCGGIWTDEERVENIRRAAREAPMFGWQATADSAAPGFYFNELLSVFKGSYVPVLAEKYLLALHDQDRGEPARMVAFWNSTLGLAWEYRGELPEEDELRKRAEKYAEWSCPAGGLVPLMQVDVQHDRLAVTVWVVGRGEEMWLAYWGELQGRTIVAHDGAWLELEQVMQRTVRIALPKVGGTEGEEGGAVQVPLLAVSIDSGDGQTSDAVYSFVRKHDKPGRRVLATKGASERVGVVEIWTRPKAIDPNKRATKASRVGVTVHTIGSAKAKDLLLGWATETGRVRLAGRGPGRLHWYGTVRDDFYEQLLGEMKIPSRVNPRVRVWTERTDRRNEVLDCTCMALHMVRHLRLHVKGPDYWAHRELLLRQSRLELSVPEPVESQPAPAVADVDPAAADAPAAPAPAPEPAPPPAARRARRPSPAATPAAAPTIASSEWSSRL